MSDLILAVDPGTTASGAVIYDYATHSVQRIWPEVGNDELLDFIDHCAMPASMAIEMIASYGMAVGASVFETCVWIGRFTQAFGAENTTKVYRKDVKMHLCGTTAAKDPNVRRALMDLFSATGGGVRPEIGTRAKPGPLYGMSKHAWPALGVALTYCANMEVTEVE